MRTEPLKGIVQSVEDPAKAGRIKASITNMDGQIYPDWIEPVFLSGWISMPEVGDTVEIVSPESEDLIEFPEEVRYRGKIWDDANAAPDEFKKNYPFRRGYKTKSGHLLIFDDKQSNEEITISHKGILLISITNNGIFFGTQNADEPMVLGTLWKTLMDTFLTKIISHTHPTGVGPSGPPAPPEGGVAGDFDTLLTGVQNSDQLSNFIFGQKVKP